MDFTLRWSGTSQLECCDPRKGVCGLNNVWRSRLESRGGGVMNTINSNRFLDYASFTVSPIHTHLHPYITKFKRQAFHSISCQGHPRRDTSAISSQSQTNCESANMWITPKIRLIFTTRTRIPTVQNSKRSWVWSHFGPRSAYCQKLNPRPW